ncbi:unnamed protein product [Peniophora sp. CBMAI 1063]|nr:unnamed protein product [Peniophora sp. CBMAI 1063]
MDTLAHNMFLNSYQLSILARLLPFFDIGCVESTWPVVGGFAKLSPEEIAAAKAIGLPIANDAINKGEIICNHLWKAQGPASDGQFFCVGWIRKSDCKSDRNPKVDKLDCGFHFTAEQVKNRQAMYPNIAWDRHSTWGLHGMTKQQIDSRAMYYRGTTNTNPAADIIRSLRSAPITLENYPFDKKITAPDALIMWGIADVLLSSRTAGLAASGSQVQHGLSVPRPLQTPPPSPEKKRRVNDAASVRPSTLRDDQ